MLRKTREKWVAHFVETSEGGEKATLPMTVVWGQRFSGCDLEKYTYGL